MTAKDFELIIENGLKREQEWQRQLHLAESVVMEISDLVIRDCRDEDLVDKVIEIKLNALSRVAQADRLMEAADEPV